VWRELIMIKIQALELAPNTSIIEAIAWTAAYA